MWEQWGVEILAFPLTWHIVYTTACCYRTSRDIYTMSQKSQIVLSLLSPNNRTRQIIPAFLHQYQEILVQHDKALTALVIFCEQILRTE